VAVCALAVFANSLPNGFVYDDVQIIRDNPRLSSPLNLRAFFGTSYWQKTADGASLYRPLTMMSFAIDRAVFGQGPGGVHAMNVLANAVLGVLVYAVLWTLLRRRDLAFVAALLYAVHPVHTEAVANGVGRAELYAAVAMLAGSLAHLGFLRRRAALADGEPVGRSAWPFLAVAVALYFVAMLFKESAVVLPGLLFLMDWLLLQRGSLRRTAPRIGVYLLYAVPLAAFLAMRIAVTGGGLPVTHEVMADLTAPQRVLFASQVLWRQVGQLAWPNLLCADYVDYRQPLDVSLSSPPILAALVAWVLLGAALWWLARRGRLVPVFAAAWFAVAILPVSNVLFSIGTIRADRLLFVPSLGFTLALAWALLLPNGRWPRARDAVAVAVLLIAGLYGWRAVIRNAEWRDQASLLQATLCDNPGSALCWRMMGRVHEERGEAIRWRQCLDRAIDLREDAGFFFPEAHNDYARMLARQGDLAGAETRYRLVLERRPDQVTALMNLGGMLSQRPESRAEAIELLQRRVAVPPVDFRAYANLAIALRLEGRWSEAETAIDRAIALEPDDDFLWDEKGRIERGLGDGGG
jgi:tetratricopeptide (TPR) repeat protein